MKNIASNISRLTFLATCLLMVVALNAPLAVPALSQSGGKPDKQVVNSVGIDLSVVAGGGGKSENNGIRIEGSVGQPVTDASTNPPLALKSGFWPNSIFCPFLISPAAQFFTISGGAERLLYYSNQQL